MNTTIKWLLFVSLLLLTDDLPDQHCPFDGYYTIAIRESKTRKPKLPSGFYLVERETARKDSCRFSGSLDSMRFLSEKEVKAEMAEDPQSTRSRYMPDWLKRDHNFLKGNRVVLLTMSQKDCMVARGNEYDLQPRQFVIRYSHNGRQTELLVPGESIYSLCGTGGSWKRIKPLEIDLSVEK